MRSADRKARVLKALNRTTEAYSILQKLQLHCEKTKGTEMIIRYLVFESYHAKWVSRAGWVSRSEGLCACLFQGDADHGRAPLGVV